MISAFSRTKEDEEKKKLVSRIMSKIVILDMKIRNKETIAVVNDVVDGCEWEARSGASSVSHPKKHYCSTGTAGRRSSFCGTAWSANTSARLSSKRYEVSRGRKA